MMLQSYAGPTLGCGMQAMDQLMPGFDREIARNAQRVLINPRPIDWHTGVLATKVTPGDMVVLAKALIYAVFVRDILGAWQPLTGNHASTPSEEMRTSKCLLLGW